MGLFKTFHRKKKKQKAKAANDESSIRRADSNGNHHPPRNYLHDNPTRNSPPPPKGSATTTTTTEKSSLTLQLESVHQLLKPIGDESQLSSREEYLACQAVYKDLRRILETEKFLQVEDDEHDNDDHNNKYKPNAAADANNRIEYDFTKRNNRKNHNKRSSNVNTSTSSDYIRNERQSKWDSNPYIPQDFQKQFRSLQEEVRTADEAAAQVLSEHPSATRPLTIETLRANVKDFFILDNSLRETTVGAPRGHTLEEKHKIVHSLAKTSLKEIILGAFGSKISVCSQIAEQWKSLGQSFDTTWGFSEIFDVEPIQEDGLWEWELDDTKSMNGFRSSDRTTEEKSSHNRSSIDDSNYYTPEFVPKTKYDKEDADLLKRASSGFRKDAFSTSLPKVLKKSSNPNGRIPMGLLMMAGYGICNAILEVDTSLETFDYAKFDIVQRIQFLMKWCRKHLAKRHNGEPTRIFVNLRDFSNYYRSPGGLQNCLFLVDSLCRLPPDERPFGFMIEEPTGWLFPSEVGRTCRMLKLTMDRAGFEQAKFLVHCHWYFGLAEASQLQALCNGANGVWAAVCKAGAQTGHACSTMTAVNLFRAGIDFPITEVYNLREMCEAARQVTEIATRKPCDSHEEIYGSHAFDIPYFMVSLPSCRYSILTVLAEIGVEERAVRLNDLSMVSSVYHAMVFYFGEPSRTGWKPEYCHKMHDAINNHLLTGLSRDYNSPLGLGHLYGLVSREKLPWAMISIMSKECKIPDTHPVVMDYIYRWNRLCKLYETGQSDPHSAAQSKSMMFWGTPAVLEPHLDSLPFEFYTADIMRNKVLEPIPNFFKLQVVNVLTNDERKIQQRKIPEVHFYEMVLRLKLFLEEADSLNVLGLVDDFCIRKNHDFFFGEDALWLRQIHGGERPSIANNLLLKQMQFYHKHYIQQGDTAISRCIVSTAKRIDHSQSIPADMRKVFTRKSAAALVHEIADGTQRSSPDAPPKERFCDIKPSHENMLRALASDEGEDPELAEELSAELYGSDYPSSDDSTKSKNSMADEYIRYRRESLRVDDAGILSSSELRTDDSLDKIVEEEKLDSTNGDASSKSSSPLNGVFGRRGSAKIVQALRNQPLSTFVEP